MARVKFQAGDEVAVVDERGDAWRVVRIVANLGNGWRTDAAKGPNVWSKTGLLREKGYCRQRIVPVTDEHKRAIRVREWRWQLADSSVWRKAPADTIEAVAKLLGWA